MDTRTRKDRHLDACLRGDVEVPARDGPAAFRFDHLALPGMDLADVDPSTTLFGRPLAWPFVIGAMTGGTVRGEALNDALARAAAASGCGLALGSMRAALEDDAVAAGFDVRSRVPDVPLLIANIGVSHAGDRWADAVLRLCSRLRADALFVHVNPLQEALQAGGDTNCRGAEERIAALRERLRAELGLPLGVKEVGFGWSADSARRLATLGVDAVETAGKGGTSWARVEGIVASDPVMRRCAEAFTGWGHDAVESLRALRGALPGTPVIASGGLRTGVDLAVALRLGAAAGAMALPVLRAASDGPAALSGLLAAVQRELRIAMFVTGSRTVADLRRATLRRMDGTDLAGEPG